MNAEQKRLAREIFADALEIGILKTQVGQEAGSLGAAAVAAVACGLWSDFRPIDTVHQVESVARPNASHVELYRRLLPVFRQSREDLGRLGEALHAVDLPLR